jgi:RNA polymerase sigma factor (sigma-70 family)
VSGNGHPDPVTRPRGLAGVVLRCQPDSRLAALVRAGYGEAFEEIARRYGHSLTAFAGSIVPAHRAEDVVQEALVKAYRSLPKADPNLNLRPWLYTIVRNTALNDLRDERSHERLDENWDGVPQPPEVAARRAELAVLFERIKGLPPQQREALVERELEGRSHEEIATAIGTTPGAVRALIFRARSALRDGAGLLIPVPVLRALMEAGPVETASGGAGLGGAATLTAGGGGVALKAGSAVVVGVLAIGSGIALHDRNHSHRDAAVAIAEGHGKHGDHASSSDATKRSAGPGGSRGEGAGQGGEAAGGPNRGSGGNEGPGGGSSSSGPSGGDGHPSGGSEGPGSGGGELSGGGGSDDGASGVSDEGGGSGGGLDGGGSSGDDGSAELSSSHDGGTSGSGATTDEGGSTTDGGGGDTSDEVATTTSTSGSGSGDGLSGLSG